MQGKQEKVPKEIGTWLLERNKKYPNIDFTIDHWDSRPFMVEKSIALKYSQLFALKAPLKGVLIVTFPYLDQSWSIRIVGGLNSAGDIADRSKDKIVKPLTSALRAEISGLPPSVDVVSENVVGILRDNNINPLKNVEEMVPLPYDLHYTSDVSMSGKDFKELTSDPEKKKVVQIAIANKDWETLKSLKENKSHDVLGENLPK
ncbi:MAG: hypothetical protein WC797_02720 [Candidatus Paceibacterota bacterium]